MFGGSANAFLLPPPEVVTPPAVNAVLNSTVALNNLLHLVLSPSETGFECGRVFPAGVGPGSPSRDAAHWLCSRNSADRLRRGGGYDWLRMVFPGARAPLPSPNLVPFGRWRHTRGRDHCRGEPGSALSGGYAPHSARAEGSSIVDEPGEC